MRLRKILCAVDFSEPSRQALVYACDLARSFDASLTLLHVYSVPGYAFPEGMVVAGPEVVTELTRRVDEALAALRDEAQDLGVTKIETRAEQGAAWAEIVRVADEGAYDLIVVGTHGRSGLRHALLGSVAEKVVRKASCPVLTVRDTETEHAVAP